MEGSAPLRAPAPSVPVALIVLNYNGRSLLEAHLPSVIAAAARSRHACQVWVLDNSSTDDSLCWLAQHYPQVRVWQAPNLGLVSYNELLAQLEAPVVILLNNDIQMDATAVDPLVEPLAVQLALPRERRRWFMTAPACWLMSDGTYEGFRTAVAWRWGLVQATARFRGHEAGISCRGPTASAGAVMAVDRESFLALGGFDLRYAPGRLEDLDLCYRAFLAGQECLYVPESVVEHRGQATFDAVLGEARTQALALRNTLLFQWKNLRHPWHLLRFAAAQPVSIDVGVLERSARVAVVPGDFGWDDVGTWEALARVRPRDADGNVVVGPVTLVACRDCIAWSDGTPVVLTHLTGMACIAANGRVLVLPRTHAADLKSTLDRLPPEVLALP